MKSTRSPILTYALFVIVALAIGGIGTIFTTPSIPTWYATLAHPAWTPPNWLFAPVWTTLYVLMGIAAARLYRASKSMWRHDALALYWCQLVFNLAWSIIFFGLHEILGGLVVILILAVLLIALIYQASKVSRAAAWLLAPYLLWVLYATSLNMGIYFLN
jgi:tryptophan-rich sensory protein